MKYIYMLYTNSPGGIKSVVDGYKASELENLYNIKYIASHESGGFNKKIISFIKSIFVLLTGIFRNDVGVIHAHVSMYASFYRKSIFMLMGKLFGVPVIFHMHGSETVKFYEGLSQTKKNYFVKILEKCDAVICLSESWEYFYKSLSKDIKCIVVENSVPIPTKKECVELKQEILFMGAIGERKGVFDLIKAWKHVIEFFPNSALYIAGSGELEKAKELTYNMGIEESVKFLGWIEKNDRELILVKKPIYVLPSYNEGLPMSVLEAMSYGCAVIVTRVGGIPELVINKYNGATINPGDVEGLKNEIVLLLSDAAKRNIYGNNAYMTVRNRFAIDLAVKKIKDVYSFVGLKNEN